MSRRLARVGLWPDGSRSRGLLARLAGDRYSAQIHGAQIGGSLVDHGPYLRWLSSGGPHPFQLELFLDALEPGVLVVDVGAHIGSHTVLAARRVGPGGSVVAIEPDESNLRALRANVGANGVAERVELIDAAASDRSGTTSLYEADDRASRA